MHEEIEYMTPEIKKKHNKDFVKFYRGFPISGYYVRTLCRSLSIGKSILVRSRVVEKTQYIVFDFDDTLVFYRSYDPLDGKIRNSKTYGRVLSWAPIEPIIDLFTSAKRQGYVTVIITARNKKMYPDTIEDCNRYGIVPDLIFMRPEGNNVYFKTQVKKRLGHGNAYYNDTDCLLSLPESKVDIVISIGDQWSDIKSSENGIKLPDPLDMNAYLVKDGEERVI